MKDFKEFESKELLNFFAAILTELKDRGVTRSANNPVADYSELLALRALNLTLTTKSNAGYDGIDVNNHKYEVKARRINKHNASRRLSALRALDQKKFDFLVGVLFAEDFSVLKACIIPHSVVYEKATYNEHTNSWIFYLRDGVWGLPGVVDITEKMREQAKII